ncbi:MAG: phosphopantothenoylcysteine decarboxylase [Patescibacteria group bacterium]|nr:phosphopantothenoylcysteine decarboxylase [Patescibacteria group bacterium]
MRVLITAGGPIVKIDDVRHIGNFSTGSFPAKIAQTALNRNHEVIYLYAKNAKIPNANRKLKLIVYETYDDYAKELKKILNRIKIDCVFLGAAVPDYGIRPHQGKISSVKSVLTLHLQRLPKVIKFVKSWSKQPLFQVGFKLLSGVAKKELLEVAYKSGLENGSDLVIANDLSKIKSGRREVFIVTPEKGFLKLQEPNLSEKIMEFVEKRTLSAHFKTVLVINKSINKKYKNEIKLFKKLCARLSKHGLMTDFFAGSKSGHGSLSLRVGGNSFLITARQSNKKILRPDDVVLVKKIDWQKRKIFIEAVGERKASFNAVLTAAIFEKFSKVNAVVHTHSFIKTAPTTDFPYTPGTLNYAIKPLNLFKKNIRIINLKNHGLVALGRDLTETVNYVLR